MHCNFCHYSRKETTHKPSNVAAARTYFCSVYVVSATCLMFFFHDDNWKILFLTKVYRYFEVFQHPCCCISIITVESSYQSSKIKLSCTLFCYTFLTDFVIVIIIINIIIIIIIIFIIIIIIIIIVIIIVIVVVVII